ncbi:alpha/beta-hydrolase family protein [Aurantimonas sp. A2-1-M11]|uniref:alpha/beta hydrolase n=1 Tax=Aurantimonas sp. A2-1-M11 TaxID=3113712 RepID=UPI002F925850
MKRFWSGISVVGLLLGLTFVAASLTPSLIPRGPVVQGVLAGVVMTLGYLCGRIVLGIWTLADMPMLKGRARRVALFVLTMAVLAILAASLAFSLVWQNDLRARMGMEQAASARLTGTLLLAAAVFALLFAMGLAAHRLYRLVRSRLERVMPPRRATTLAFVAVGGALFIVTRDGLLDATIGFLDASYEEAQELFDAAPPAPAQDRVPGSPASLVDWAGMGQPGRDFVTSGPDATAISAFTGAPARDPVRVYVGRANAETPQARAALALEELIRLDAFDRSILVVASPTGTGWMDPGSHDPLEYMHGGDVATVAVQYSYMQSPFALLFETQTGLEQASATLSTIHAHWKTLPEDARPRLYVHGLSLGAWSSMHATNLFYLVDQPIAGAFWVGPPFPSQFWQRAQRMRDPTSPWVQPRIGDGSLARVASRTSDGSEGAAPWGRMRIVFLQYPSDPIVFYEPQSVWRRPVWMAEPPGDGVSPYLRFLPIVTHFQLAVDMALSTATRAGYGHAYYGRDYIAPWAEVTAPDGWTAADTERLRGHCDHGFQLGCSGK